MELLPNYYKWTYGTFGPYLQGQAIELGCGAGLGIATYIDRIEQVVAVDYDEGLLRRVREALPEGRIRTIQADLRGEWTELAGLSADVVVLMDVLEHFSDDAAFLEKAVALAKPGGFVVVKVPAQSALYSPMDQASGHFKRYDPSDIEDLANRVGVEVQSVRPLNCLGGLAYRLKNRQSTNFSKSFAPWQLRAINLGLPLVRLFDLVPGLPGLSLAAVLRRPV